MNDSSSLAKARGKARRLAMQAIYQWQMTGDDVSEILGQFQEANDMNLVDADYFTELLQGVCRDADAIDPILENYMDRSAKSVDPVERAILRLACYEFINRPDVPYKVVLNEAISLTKKFCARQSHTFINAVLDKVAREVRAQEVSG